MILTLLIAITILQINFQFLSSHSGYFKSAKTIKYLTSRLLTNEKANNYVTNNEIKKYYKNSDDIFGSKILKEFLLLKKSSENQYEYSSILERGGHISNEKFDYIPRDIESVEVVKYMVDRQKLRMTSNAFDKQTNNLIVVPGSPGIGKTTFLCHFPESPQYREYINNRSLSSPIVSALTFNSAMDGGDDLFELRIIYGSIISMGLIDGTEYPWYKFFKQFESYELDVFDVIELLHLLFGKDRPILILVDELSKTKKPVEVMRLIGTILNRFGLVDVIVSSLSPKFIRDLLTGSQRNIDYAVIAPLLNSSLGKRECEVWGNYLFKSTKDVDQYKLNLTRIAYLFYSGHPRSIEDLVVKLEEEEKDWEALEERMKKSFPFSMFLKQMISKLPTYQAILSELSDNQLEKFVFRHPVTYPACDPDFRDLLEEGNILIHNRINDDKFVTCVQLKAIFDLIQSRHFNKFQDVDSRCGAAHFFLNEVYDLDNIVFIWEKFVLLNIVIRSYEKLSISELFGIDFNVSDLFTNTNAGKIKFGKNVELYPNSDKIIVSKDPYHPGNDGLVTLNIGEDQSLLFFIQVEISKSDKDFKGLVIRMIIHNLLEYLRSVDNNDNNNNNNNNNNKIPLENVNMILYIGECKQDIFDIFKRNEFNEFINVKIDELMELVANAFEDIKLNQKSLPSNFNEEFIREYLTNNFNQVHFVGKDKMKSWLSPSFLPLPLIVSALDEV